MSDIVLLIDWLYSIDLFSCIAASLFNKLLTYLLTYLLTDRLIGRYRRLKRGKSLLSLHMTRRLLYVYFRLRTTHCLCQKLGFRVRISRVGDSVEDMVRLEA